MVIVLTMLTLLIKKILAVREIFIIYLDLLIVMLSWSELFAKSGEIVQKMINVNGISVVMVDNLG